MRIALNSENPTVPQVLLVYFSVLFFWHFVFSFVECDNVDFLKYAAAAATIYTIAKAGIKQNLLGRPLNAADIAEVTLLCAATVLTGIGCWALLVFFDAVANDHGTAERWGLISRQRFDQLQWSTPWLIGYFLTASLIVPITEEIIFRGFVLSRLLERYGCGISIIASAALFAALHFDKSYLGTFVHGLILAVLVVRTSSLYASMLVHGLYNATVFTLRVLFGVSVVGDARTLSRLSYWTPELLCGAAGLALLAVYFLAWPLGPYSKTVRQGNSSVKPELAVLLGKH